MVDDVLLLAENGQLFATLLGVQACHSVEVSNVVPAEGTGNHCDVACCRCGLSHSIVDSSLRQGLPDAVHNSLALGGVPSVSDFHDARVQLGFVRLEVLEHQGRRCHEHACVPGVFTGIQVLLRGSGIGLLHEGVHSLSVGGTLDAQGLAGVNVAKRAGGLGGSNADGDNLAGCRGDDSFGHNTVEFIHGADHVVSCEGANDGVRFAAVDNSASQADSCSRILGGGLQHQVSGTQFRNLLGDRIGVRSAGNHHDGTVAEVDETVVGVTQQRIARRGEVEQEFRGVRAGQGPQTRANTAGGNERAESSECSIHRFKNSG